MNLSFRIKKSTEFVFDYLTDMQKFASVHPVISHIDKDNDNSYLVLETLKVAMLPFSFTYPVHIKKSKAEKIVIISATVFKWTKITMIFFLKAEGEYTVVEEKIRFKSPLPIKFIMEKTFKKQHTVLFKNIELAENNLMDCEPK